LLSKLTTDDDNPIDLTPKVNELNILDPVTFYMAALSIKSIAPVPVSF